MDCPLCGGRGEKIFRGQLLNRYTVQYFQCHECALVFTETPYWLEEAYEDSITCVDTGIMSRNVRNVFCANILIDRFFDRDAVFLDYGGGYGVFTRMMRDVGYDWKWQDKYSQNLLARGFEYQKHETIELVSAFELFEHFSEPKKELDNLFDISDNILFSTLLYDKGTKYKKFSDWWYYVPNTGQHVVFYSERTCGYIANAYGVNYYHLGSDLHLFTKKNLNKNYLYIFLKNKATRFLLQTCFYKKNEKRGKCFSDMESMVKKLNL